MIYKLKLTMKIYNYMLQEDSYSEVIICFGI